jgi:hypothetical protein
VRVLPAAPRKADASGLAAAVAAPFLAALAACGGDPPRPAPAPPATQVRPAAAAVGAAAPAPADGGVTPPLFVDVTDAAGVDFRHDTGAEGRRYMPESVCSGACVLDADGDGRLDLYLVQAGPVPGSGSTRPRLSNRLFRNRGDGTFEDVTEASGAGDTGFGLGATCVDHDGDGDTDIHVVNFGRNTLLENDGRGRFTDVTARAGVGDTAFGSSAVFFDADGDGALDLHVVNYVAFTVATHVTCRERGVMEAYCHPDSYPAAQDVFYRGRGDGTYEEATARAGLVDRGGKGLGAVVLDFDDDGDPDLYVANDSTPNRLWSNAGDGTFADVGLALGVAFSEDGLAEAGMGVDAGDVDGDLRLDLVVTNYAAESNALYLNGARSFRHGSRAASLRQPSLPHVGFGIELADLDADGDLDLAVANGHIIDNIAEADPAQAAAQPGQVFLNDGAGRFEVLPAQAAGSPSAPCVGRTLLAWDPDSDGRLDLVVTCANGRARLHRNVHPSPGRFVGFLLEGPPGSRAAIGARVTIEAGGRRQVAERRAGSSYQGSGDPRLHFGLGAADAVDRVTVRWRDGRVTSHERLAAGRYYRLSPDRAPEALVP